MKSLPNNVLKRMNKKALSEMHNAAQDGDTEGAHCSADSILTGLLRELGFTELVDVYDEIDKWFA